MGKLKFSVHPLFFIFGLYFAIFGKVFSFIVVTLSALIHEAGHGFTAEKLGYKLRTVTLMPYGAIIKGDLYGISYKDELKVVFAGPFINLLIAIFFVALWWLFPNVYPYTELVVTTNFALFTVNLIPAYPLDGGRFLLCTLSLFLKRSKALKICRIISFVCVFLLFGLFIYSAFIKINLSILFFAVFILFSLTDKNPDNAYIRIYGSLSKQSLKNGKEIKEIAVTEDFTVKKLYAVLDGASLLRVKVYSESGEVIKVFEPEEVIEILSTKSLYDAII